MRGMIAPRAADAIAKLADCTATRARISRTLLSPNRVCSSRPIVPPHVTRDAIRYSTRRSTASAIAPPYRPNTTIGTSPTRPTRPTISDERVIE